MIWKRLRNAFDNSAGWIALIVFVFFAVLFEFLKGGTMWLFFDRYFGGHP